MAGRFLLQKFSSGTSRSTSLLGAHASASARAAAPVTPPCFAGIKTLSNVFHGAVHPCTAVTSNHGTQGNAARYFNRVSGSHTVAKTSWPITGTPSIIINRVKPAFVDCAGGVKRPFSSSSSNNHRVSSEAERADRGPDIATHAAALDKTTTTIMGQITFIAIFCMYMFDNASGGRTSSKNMQRKGSGSKGQCGGSLGLHIESLGLFISSFFFLTCRHAAALDKTTTTIMGQITFIAIFCMYMFDNASGGRTSSKNMQRKGSGSKGQCGGSNPKTVQ